MEYGVLNLGNERTTVNKKNGRFMKGHVPANKGKKWDEFMSKKGQRNSKKGWKNLGLYRPKTRPDNAGRCRKAVIAVTDEGKWFYFEYIGQPCELGFVGSRENIRRCCQFNQKRHKNLKTGKVNTDHKYQGMRWYYESDEQWLEKIKTQ